LLGGRDLGGGAAYLPGACVEGIGYGISMAMQGFFPYPLQDHSAQNWDVVLMGHEVGHNFNAIHTHDMVPRIDNCAGGDCTNASEATLMSYCVWCPGGMANYNLSYHPRVLNEFILPYLATINCDTVTPACDVDFDNDGDVDLTDFLLFAQCFGGAANPPAPGCPDGLDADCDDDGDVDLADFTQLAQSFTGSL
jgi:hypothetical protein